MRKKLVLLAFALTATTAASLLTPTPAYAYCNGRLIYCGDPEPLCCPFGRQCFC